MENGNVKFFSIGRFFGFITADDGSELFFHGNDIINRIELFAGDRVKFNTVSTEKGKAAIDVEKSDGE